MSYILTQANYRRKEITMDRYEYKEFVKQHETGLIICSSLFLVTVLTGIFVTASGKMIVMEFDGLNSTVQDSDGNYEEKHIDGGKLKLYAQ